MKKIRYGITRSPWLWILMAGFVLYALSFSMYYAGYFNDDASYILGAKSLMMGKYVSLDLPGQPPKTAYPPGFSLFLVPFVWLCQPHWQLLKCVSIILTCLN